MSQIVSAEEMQARRRAALIVQVQCGQITATEAAGQLGVTRKTYYVWEKRALQALVASQRERLSGRPSKPRDAEKESLQQKAKQLQEQTQVLAWALKIHQQAAELSPVKKKP